MTSELPFRDYSKDQLPSGQSYVVGRDTIAAELARAGAKVRSLSLSRAPAEPHESRIALFAVRWDGDGGTRIFGHQPEDDVDRLVMQWRAVRSEVRQVIAKEVTEQWLPQACEWARAALERENVWRANNHHWMLRVVDETLQVDVT